MRGFGIIRIGFGALAAISGAFLPPSLPEMRLNRQVTAYGGGKGRRKTTYHATNGKRECARRRRQIAAGILRKENGLAEL